MGNNPPVIGDGNVALISACRYNNDIKTIKFMITEQNLDPNVTDENGDNCLMIACKYNKNPDIIKLLVGYKMDPKMVNKNGDTCLMMACQYNSSVEIIKLLVSMKINIYRLNNDGEDCLLKACKYNQNVEILRYLINEKKLNPKGYLAAACYSNQNVEIIDHLITGQGLDPYEQNELGNICLNSACMNSNPDIIKYLVQNHKINPYMRTKIGNNYLLLACSTTISIEVAEYLIELKIDPNTKNNEGYNCLMIACKYSTNTQIIEYLIKKRKMLVPLIKECNSTILKYLNHTGYLPFTNCCIKPTFNKDNFDELLDHIELYKIIGNILRKNVLLNMSYDQLKILKKYGIQINLGKPKKYIKDRLIKYDNFSKSEHDHIFTINGVSYYGNKKLLKIVCPDYNKIEQYERISEKVMKIYLNIAVYEDYNLDSLTNIEIIELILFLEKYPLTNCKIENLEYYLVRIENNDILDMLCDKYKLRFVLSKNL